MSAHKPSDCCNNNLIDSQQNPDLNPNLKKYSEMSIVSELDCQWKEMNLVSYLFLFFLLQIPALEIH